MVGDLDLLERVLEETVLAILAPGPGNLVLVEDPEPHSIGSLASLGEPLHELRRQLEDPTYSAP
jgi:hypothetical protein